MLFFPLPFFFLPPGLSEYWADDTVQMQFAAVTVAIVMGAIAERGRVLPAMVFSFLWVTVVYCPIACWVWNPNGWAFKYGVLDYAGKISA